MDAGKKYWILLGYLWIALSACADLQEHPVTTLGQEETTSQDNDAPNDPFEPVNRVLFEGNLRLDRLILRPLSLIYRDTFPEKIQESIGSAIANFQAPVTFANDVLQGKGERAAQTFARFAINSTAGIGGLFDVAQKLDLPGHNEDFGQTLAVWGVSSGPYLMVPIVGPSSPRDLIGKGVDLFLDPENYVFNCNNLSGMGGGIRSSDIVHNRANLVDLSDQLESESVDYYASIRSIYFQKRYADMSDGSQTTADTIENELYDFSTK